ncbi:MAG: hypothetical protein A2133_11230 [Actinobacteria bacterium RBG_16_64_13]|nr:MAG: hypothetical protein A2133_11230 [Actinobacteria bacterium RBG_16_64_13]
MMGLTLVVVLLLVVLIAASCGGSTTTTTGATTATTAASTTTSGGSAIDAAALYAANCVGCHSTIPEGDAAEMRSVTESGNETMPGFKDKLTADEITALVNHMTSGGQGE